MKKKAINKRWRAIQTLVLHTHTQHTHTQSIHIDTPKRRSASQNREEKADIEVERSVEKERADTMRHITMSTTTTKGGLSLSSPCTASQSIAAASWSGSSISHQYTLLACRLVTVRTPCTHENSALSLSSLKEVNTRLTPPSQSDRHKQETKLSKGTKRARHVNAKEKQ